MKKIILKIMNLAIFLIIIFSLKNMVNANSINSINMDIYIDNNGNAEVTELWDCYTDQGTECYHPYYNLGNSKITNLRVFDNKDYYYEQLSSWNTNDTMIEKAYKCGINSIYNGVELCWGISNYGSNVYTVKYNISNFVSELTDAQMMYWTLIPHNFSVSLGSVKIKIHAEKEFENTMDVWGYGNYGGYCYVKDGVLYIESGYLSSYEYITFLAKLPKNTFNTNNVLQNDFEYYYEMAEDGSKHYNYSENDELEDNIYNNKKEASKEKKFKIKFIIFGFVFPCTFMIVFTWIVIKKSQRNIIKFKYGKAGKIKNKNVPYYRDIPFSGDILKAYYLSIRYKLTKKKTDVIGAILLKWIKLGIIKIQEKDQEKILNKEETSFILENKTTDDFENNAECALYEMMLEASRDGILESKEFTLWCEKNYLDITNWLDTIFEEQEREFINDGSIICINKKRENKDYIATEKLKSEAEKIAGLKRFLLDYTLIKEREAIEVELFEDYLIYAELLGIAKQVSNQFEEIYPGIIEQTHYKDYNDIISIDYCVSMWYLSAVSKKHDVETSNTEMHSYSDYSSGGGGRSSGGGGSGSFGGGGGGGGFR